MTNCVDELQNSNVTLASNEEAIDAMEVAGAFDHGIDALIMSNEKLIIIQTKYETSHDWSEVTKFHYDMSRIKEHKVREEDANDNAHRVIVDIQDAYAMDWDVTYYYITSSELSLVEHSKAQSLKGYGVDFFCYGINEIANFINRKSEDVPSTIRGKYLTLRLFTREILKFADTTTVIAVKLADMHDFVKQGGNDLFASNVRQYLKSKINSGIKDTITNHPEQFWLYNNGITIVCDDFEEENFSIKILTPQIVNGCQTAKSIWDVLSRQAVEERKQLAGHVLVRIIKGADEDQKEKITRYTNTQNAVRGKDFFSLEQFQKKLNRKFKQFGYFYEIQRGSYTSLKSSEKAKYKGIEGLHYLVSDHFKNVIPALESVQAYAAGFKQIPATSYGNPSDLTPGGSWYDKVFEDSLQPEVRLFLYPYLIREWAKNNNYSRGGGGWRAHSALFFVYTYFVIILETLKSIGFIDALENSPENISLEIWDKVFYSESLNLEFLQMTDEILDRYFSDSKVDDAVGLDVRKFLKSQETLNRYKSILIRHVGIVLSRHNNLSTELKTVLTTE